MEQYAILTETEPGVFDITMAGDFYGDVVFGENSTIQDRKDAGLYHYIDIVPDTLEFQRVVFLNNDIDDIEKTVTVIYEVQDFSPEEKYTIQMFEWKTQREELVNNIEVLYNGVIYQGDETSQDRMSRTINALPDDVTIIPWTAKDNTIHGLTKSDLRIILLDAGTQQSTIWNSGRPTLGE